MATKQIDVEDVVGLVLYPLVGGIAFGTLSLGVNIDGVPDLPIILAEGSNWEVTVAGLVAFAAITWIGVTNLRGRGKNQYTRYEWAAVAVAIGALPLYMVVPPVHEFINNQPIVGLLLVLVQSVGAVLLSYYG